MLRWVFFVVILSSFLQAEETLYTKIENQAVYPILSPTFAKQKVEKLRLNNGVEMLLISDPNTTQSAAAVCVEAGSWQDPPEYPGMAHFLEHMLFMGTKAYPNEDDFSKYVQDQGGKINAFTASDRTVYMFSINNSGLVGALDRFSHFFVDPLFNPSSIHRELNAVDQEHSKNIENDYWRAFMVLKETSTPGHPMTKFSTGNAKTLSGIPQSALKDWYKTHYTGEKLHVAILSSLPMEKLLPLAVQSFSLVENSNGLKDPSLDGSIFCKEQQGHMLYIQPVKDLKMLSMKWELPKNLSTVEQKWTEALISYALAEASTTSLIHELKKENLVESISSGSDRFGKEEVFFHIDIKLTSKGLLQLDTVILRCFQALARLKQSGLPFSLFQEIQTMAKLNYQYQSREDPFEWVMETAYNLADEPLSSFPEKTAIPFEFKPEELLQFVSILTPETAVYVLIADSDQLGIETPLRETWMDVAYAIKPISPSKIATWQQATPYGEIGLPPSNPFIPQKLEIISSSLEAAAPEKFVSSNKALCFFAKDTQFHTPEGSLLLRVKTPALDGSARAEVLSSLLCKSLDKSLASTLFFAKNAGLSGSISSNPSSIVISVDGYSEKGPMLALQLLSSLYKNQCTEDDFNAYKHSLLSAYANGAFELPAIQGMNFLMSQLKSDFHTFSAKKEALENISYEEFMVFTKSYLHSIYLEGMVSGNFSQEEITKLGENLLETVKPSLAYENRTAAKVLVLSKTAGPFKVEKTTTMQGQGCVLAIEFGLATPEKTALQKLLSDPLHEAFFDTLRTKQQTGYIAQSWPRELENELVQFFVVQSSNVPPDNLLVRFELFLEEFSKRIQETISEERFASLKKAQTDLLEAPYRSIEEQNTLLYHFAFKKEGDFLWKEKVLQALNNLSYDQFLSQVVELLSTVNRQRLAVLVQGKSPYAPFLYQTVAQDDPAVMGTFSSTY